MKRVLFLLLAAAASVWMAAAFASSKVKDVGAALEDNHIDIKSLLDPAVTLPDSDPVAVALPDNPSIADKRLAVLIKLDLVHRGLTVTSPDKSKWTLVAKVEDQTSALTCYASGDMVAAPVEYTRLTVMVTPSRQPGSPVWSSTVRAYDDFWMTHPQVIVAGILATYGHDFYYRDATPIEIPDLVEKDDGSKAPSLEKIKACLADPSGSHCKDVLGSG